MNESKLNETEILIFEILQLSRLMPLGQDRYHNTYWFMDHHYTLPPPEIKLRGRPNYRRTLTWGSGKLFVESSHKEWGYYDSIIKVQELMLALDPRGTRESELLTCLQSNETGIRYVMEKRNDELRDPGSCQLHEIYVNRIAI